MVDNFFPEESSLMCDFFTLISFYVFKLFNAHHLRNNYLCTSYSNIGNPIRTTDILEAHQK